MCCPVSNETGNGCAGKKNVPGSVRVSAESPGKSLTGNTKFSVERTGIGGR